MEEEEKKERFTEDSEADEKKQEDKKTDKVKKKLNYSAYYNDIIVREQPFYNSDKSYKSKFTPLGNKEWFK